MKLFPRSVHNVVFMSVATVDSATFHGVEEVEHRRSCRRVEPATELGLDEDREPVARAREVAARDNEIDRLYHRVFEDLVKEMGNGHADTDDALRDVTLLLVAHNLERISDRVTNVAEDIVFLESGQVVELG